MICFIKEILSEFCFAERVRSCDRKLNAEEVAVVVAKWQAIKTPNLRAT